MAQLDLSPAGARVSPITSEVEYGALELEAIRLAETYRQSHGLPFMYLQDYLRCFLQAGWIGGKRPRAGVRTKRLFKGGLTTGQVARLCGVSHQTAIYWCDHGHLPSSRLNGGTHRRITREALLQFMRAAQIPIPAELETPTA